MSHPTESSANTIAKSDAQSNDGQDGGLSTIARRITSRTTDLIAIGIVLIGGLSMGRQIVEWWQAEPPIVAAPATADTGWGAGETPVELQFGDYPLALRRQTVTGGRESAMTGLVNACRASLESGAHADLPGGSGVERLLAHTASLEPLAEDPGAWQIYRLEDQFAMILGVRLSDTNDSAEQGATRRLACWGLAAPFEDDVWTLYLFQPTGSDRTDVAAAPEIPLPPEGRRLLGLRGADGSALIGFSGSGLPQEWISFFDERLGEQGWKSRDGWTSGKGTWSSRFEAEDRSPSARIAIEISRDAVGELRGLIQIIP